MSSNDGDCNDEVDFEKHRKVYEADEHWNLRKVRINRFVYILSSTFLSF